MAGSAYGKGSFRETDTARVGSGRRLLKRHIDLLWAHKKHMSKDRKVPKLAGTYFIEFPAFYRILRGGMAVEPLITLVVL